MHVFYGKDKFLDNCISVIELPRLSCPDYPKYEGGQLMELTKKQKAGWSMMVAAIAGIFITIALFLTTVIWIPGLAVGILVSVTALCVGSCWFGELAS